jgi:hypothetical protein
MYPREAIAPSRAVLNLFIFLFLLRMESSGLNSIADFKDERQACQYGKNVSPDSLAMIPIP